MRWEYLIALLVALMAANLLFAARLHLMARRVELGRDRLAALLPDEQVVRLQQASDRCVVAALLLGIVAVVLTCAVVLTAPGFAS